MTKWMTFDEIVKKPYEFARGYFDCVYGVKHTEKDNAEYDRGYNTRHQEEQIAGAKS